eukprot:TRINITY_DN584_c0_g1_i2.p1 TRINITY_DN584_c0_g1~~TRINITY_DN584_c0_g1_i2.p1  ORF type:complete len:129 (+),score=5.31 TRINITY_DN584_c0_g1_i2:618-1004(+)
MSIKSPTLRSLAQPLPPGLQQVHTRPGLFSAWFIFRLFLGACTGQRLCKFRHSFSTCALPGLSAHELLADVVGYLCISMRKFRMCRCIIVKMVGVHSSCFFPFPFCFFLQDFYLVASFEVWDSEINTP